MYKHILVAIDDSETSKKALDEAIVLAKVHEATLEIVHAIDDSLLQSVSTHGASLTNTEPLQKALNENAQGILDQAKAIAVAGGVTPQTRLLISEDLHIADQIADAVEQGNIDLLVMGSHGRRGFRRLLIGSVAEKVVRKVSVSILIVRGQQAAPEQQPQ